jgi:hypothetical protein
MRFNSFNLIHKALRALLYDTALTLQRTDFADVEEANAAIAKVETVIHQFEQHAYHEDTFILPAIEVFNPQLVEDFEKEHVEDIELGNRLNYLLSMFKALERNDERVQCGSAINKAFREFMVFNIEHMAKEEVDINKTLWQHYTDLELMQLNARLAASIAPEEKAFSAKWMMRSINKSEAIAWLKVVKQSAPDSVFRSLFGLTETELPADIRAAVQDAVMEPAMAI